MQMPTRKILDGKMEYNNGVYVWVDSTLANLRETFASVEVFEHVHQFVKDSDRWRFDSLLFIEGRWEAMVCADLEF
ncbi:MAG: hypothetical protein HN520_00435 [Euryarchaeota archaeon]|jgi:hypothetical protein|nr:hypothetical protein [Euryarchaeota archaeon]